MAHRGQRQQGRSGGKKQGWEEAQTSYQQPFVFVNRGRIKILHQGGFFKVDDRMEPQGPFKVSDAMVIARSIMSRGSVSSTGHVPRTVV